MEKSELIGRIFGIALVVTMLAAMLGATPGISSANDGAEEFSKLNSSLLSTSTNAQALAQASIVIISNEYLTMVVYPDGNFRGSTASGDYILYPSSTSDLTIKIGSSEYSVYHGTLSSYRTEDSYINPYNDEEAITEWDLPQGIHVEQHIKLEGDHVTFTVNTQNSASSDQQVSVRYLWDTQLCDNDGSPLKAEGTLYTTEMCFEPVDFDHWTAYSRPEESESELVTYAWWADVPDKVIFSHWPFAIGSVYSYSWNPARQFYTPGYVTNPESDSCVLMYWENVNIPAHGGQSITACYGVSLSVDVSLSMGLDKGFYNPNDMMRIAVAAADVSTYPAMMYPITTDNTEVRIDGTRVDIEDITSELLIEDGYYLVPWQAVQIVSVRAPSEVGPHTVWVQVVTDQGAASDSRDFDVWQPFTFVQMTDVHIGPQHAAGFLIDAPTSTEKDVRFSAAIDEMNQGIRIQGSPPLERPDFVLITGDITERGYEAAPYERFLQHLQSLDDSIEVFTLPGNHDWYGDWATYMGLWFTSPLLYPPPFWPFYSLQTYRTYLQSPDFIFHYGGFSFIGLDSGPDVGVSFASIGGNGLTSAQIQYLESLPSSESKIVFMHHPVLPIISNVVITQNRQQFLEYCTDNNVQLVLSGHTHKSRVFDASGEALDEGDLLSTTTRPLFIETPSTCDDTRGYRVIRGTSDGVTVYPYTPTWGVQYLSAAANCPVQLHAYDSQGRHTGPDVSTGGSELDIPRSFYLSGYTYETYNITGENVTETAPETIFLYDVSQDYSFEVIANLGEEQGSSTQAQSFNFTVERQTTESRITIFYPDIPLLENTTATLPFNLSTTDYDLLIDYDGDGTVDEMRVPDSIETDYAPTATILSPGDGSAFLQGENITFAGNGTDPEDGVLLGESLAWISDIDGVIGSGNELSLDNLSVGTHNITLRVNDSCGQVDTSTISIFVESTQPDLFVDVLTSGETPGPGAHTTVIETLADQPCNVTAYIQNTGAGTLHDVQVLTNVGVVQNVGQMDEGEIAQIPVEFTPTLPGVGALNVTVVSDEIEGTSIRGLLVQKFGFAVSVPKTDYNLGEPVPIDVSVTNEVPGMRFVDLKIQTRINGSYEQTFEIPLLSLAPLESRNTTFTWDTTGIDSGMYTITTSLVMADQVLMTDTKLISLGNQSPVADAGSDQTVCATAPAMTAMVTLDGSGSYDPDSDPLTYNWTWDGNTASGMNPTVELPPGTITITLVVNDGNVDSEPDTVNITVRIPADVDFVPNILNMKAKGKYVTAYIELPPGCDVGQIDIASIRLNGIVPASAKPAKVCDYDKDGIPDLMVKFDRRAVQAVVEAGKSVEIIVTGEVNGIQFTGTDTIRVIHP